MDAAAAPPPEDLRRARALLDEDPRAQQLVWRAQRWGWSGMALLVAAAVAGLLGAGGPLGTQRARGAPPGLEITYEAVTRQSRATTWTVLLPPGADTLMLADPATETFVPQRILPRPRTERRVAGALVLAFHPPEGEEALRVRIIADPASPGRHALRLSSAGSVARLHIIVLP